MSTLGSRDFPGAAGYSSWVIGAAVAAAIVAAGASGACRAGPCPADAGVERAEPCPSPAGPGPVSPQEPSRADVAPDVVEEEDASAEAAGPAEDAFVPSAAAAASRVLPPAPPDDAAGITYRVPHGAKDIWAGSCDDWESGDFWADEGMLWYHPDEVRHLSWLSHESAEHLDELAAACWAGEEEDPESCERASWAHADLLLGSLRGRFSALLPHPEPGKGFAVRFEETRNDREDVEAWRSSLVVIEAATLAVEPVWSTAGALLLLGRSGTRAVALLWNPEEAREEVRVVAIDLRTGQPSLSDPVPIDLNALGLWTREWNGTERRHFPLDLGAYQSGPVGADGFAFRCGPSTVCVARIGDDGISVSRVALAVLRFHVSARGLAMLVDKGGVASPDDDVCLEAGDAPPEAWPTLERGSCPDRVSLGMHGRRDLPVDGTPTAGLKAWVRACLVTDQVTLPGCGEERTEDEDDDEDEEDEGEDEDEDLDRPDAIGVVMLLDTNRRASSGPGAGEDPWATEPADDPVLFDFLAYGCALVVGATYLEAIPPGMRRWGPALPPGSVEARSVMLDGLRTNRVTIRASADLRDVGGECRQVNMAVRAGWVEAYNPNEAWAQAAYYTEYGVCE